MAEGWTKFSPPAQGLFTNPFSVLTGMLSFHLKYGWAQERFPARNNTIMEKRSSFFKGIMYVLLTNIGLYFWNSKSMKQAIYRAIYQEKAGSII
jgi:hypothetical protein